MPNIFEIFDRLTESLDKTRIERDDLKVKIAWLQIQHDRLKTRARLLALRVKELEGEKKK